MAAKYEHTWIENRIIARIWAKHPYRGQGWTLRCMLLQSKTQSFTPRFVAGETSRRVAPTLKFDAVLHHRIISWMSVRRSRDCVQRNSFGLVTNYHDHKL
jgi:hypothetical protein